MLGIAGDVAALQNAFASLQYNGENYNATFFTKSKPDESAPEFSSPVKMAKLLKNTDLTSTVCCIIFKQRLSITFHSLAV